MSGALVSEREAASEISRYFLSLDQASRMAFIVGLAVGREQIPNSVILRLLPEGERL